MVELAKLVFMYLSFRIYIFNPNISAKVGINIRFYNKVGGISPTTADLLINIELITESTNNKCNNRLSKKYWKEKKIICFCNY